MTPPEDRPADDWLHRLSPKEWLKAGVAELERAERALATHDRARAVAGLKRAAGMTLNAALIVRPDESWGRTYVEHLAGLAETEGAPREVRDAAALLVGLEAAQRDVVTLGSPARSEVMLEAARTVMAHAYAIVYGERRGGPA